VFYSNFVPKMNRNL